MSDYNLKFLNATNIIANAKVGALQVIHDKFDGDWERAWRADLTKYIPRDRDIEGKLVAPDYAKMQKRIDPDKEWSRLASNKIVVVTILDQEYPELLRHIPDPPFLLYVRGNTEAWTNQCFGVVGTRALSEYGKRVVPHITLDVARAGFNIVSGLAAGIDTLAHKTALEADISTIAVLGTGIDDATIFPPQNLGLAHKIIEKGGAVISEYAIGTHGTKFSFPQRNRIISGLSRGVLVVEADAISGALITARCAAEQGRDVFAIPGNIFAKTSQGTNNILKKGAKIVTCAEDILEEYELEVKNKKIKVKIKADNPAEEKILAVLSSEAIGIDDIIRQTELAAHEANAALTLMELKKKVKNLGGKFVLYQ
ncbi:MAG: DNA-processing protein DprA [Patescibacteria group bacterium]